MGKLVHDNVLDAALNYLENANRLIVLSAEPASYANATTNYDSSGYKLAEATISASDFTGPANGDTSGRKMTIGAQNSMSINGVALTANATHVALVKVSSVASSQLVLYVTTCTSQTLTGGNKVNTPAWTVEIRDPS